MADAHVNSTLITALVVGIPSATVAIASYWLSTRASRSQSAAQRGQIDADAYTRARELYESAIGELRNQIADLRAEVDRLITEVKSLRSRRR